MIYLILMDHFKDQLINYQIKNIKGFLTGVSTNINLNLVRVKQNNGT